jgi:phage protein D
MTTPTRRDPTGDKRRALSNAARLVKRWRKAEEEAVAAMAFAKVHASASLREIEEATGVNYRTVGRMIDRHDEGFYGENEEAT